LRWRKTWLFAFPLKRNLFHMNEWSYLEKLFDLYYEVYQNTFDKYEKRNIAQILTDLMHQRARFDLEANYFTMSYRLEVSCLYKQAKITKLILDKMVMNDHYLNWLPFLLCFHFSWTNRLRTWGIWWRNATIKSSTACLIRYPRRV
jgi:hypothetical protein